MRTEAFLGLIVFAILIVVSYNVDAFAEDKAIIEFLEDSYAYDGTAVVRVTDSRMDNSPYLDTVDVVLFSDADTIGTTITLQETDNKSGIFEGTVFFVLNDYTSGHRLQVVQGGFIYATYKGTTSSATIEGTPSPITDTSELEEIPSNPSDAGTIEEEEDTFASSDSPGFNVMDFGMFDEEDEGNLVNELQVGKTYWFRIVYQNELQARQDVGILVQMTDKNKNADNVLEGIDGHGVEDPRDGMEHRFEWVPEYPGEFLLTAELYTKDGPSVSDYSEFDFTVVSGSLSLKQQIENKIPAGEITCNDEGHVLVERSNGKLACVSQDTVDHLDWSMI